MTEQSREIDKNAKIIKIMENLKEDIIRELPQQKKYLKTQEKLKNEFENFKISYKDNKLVLEKLDLELEKFHKMMISTTEDQTERFSELIGTIAKGYDEFQQSFSIFKNSIEQSQKENLSSFQDDFLPKLREDLDKLHDSLQLFGDMVEMTGATSAQIMKNQNNFATSEQISLLEENLVEQFRKNLEKTEEIINNSSLSSLLCNISNKISKNPVPDLLQTTQTNIVQSINEHFQGLNEKLDQSTLPAQLLELNENQVANTEKLEVGLSKINEQLQKSPVPQIVTQIVEKIDQLSFDKLLESTRQSLISEFSQQFSELHKKYDSSSIPEKVDLLRKDLMQIISQILIKTEEKLNEHFKRIENENYYKPIFNKMEEIQTKSNNSLSAALNQSLNNSTSKLGKEQTLGGIQNQLGNIGKYLEKVGKESSFEGIKKQIAGLNTIPDLRKIQTQIQNLTNTTAKDQQISSLYKTIAQLNQQLTSLGKEASIQSLQKLLKKQDAIPLIQNLSSQLQKIVSPLATQQQVNDVKSGLQTIKQDISKLPAKNDLEGIRKGVELSLPNRIEQTAKELRSSDKELQNILIANKAMIQKSSENMNLLRNQVAEKSSAQSIKEFRTVFEHSIPSLKTEIKADLNKINQDHQDQAKYMDLARENFSKLNSQTQSIPELTNFVKNDLYSQTVKGNQDLSQIAKNISEVTSNIAREVSSINGRVALESTLASIKKYTSEEGYKLLLEQIKKAILPVIQNTASPLAQQHTIDILSTDLNKILKNISIELKQSQINQDKSNENIKNIQIQVNSLPNKENFEQLQKALDHAIHEKIPSVIEESLLVTAREETLEKLKDEVRQDLKEIFRTESVLNEIIKSNNSDIHDFRNDFAKFQENYQETLSEIQENVSSGKFTQLEENIKTSLSRLAREDSLATFKNYYERQNNTMTEITEDIKNKILINQTKLANTLEKLDLVTTMDDLSNLGEFMIENVKLPLEKELLPLLKDSATEKSLSTNHESLMEILSHIAKHDDIIDIKANQNSTNKFLHRIIKLLEENQNEEDAIKEQINHLSEKLTLVFEFLKRVSGV